MKEILLLSYWEHYKRENELARVYPPEHPKRVELNKALKEILNQINDKRTLPTSNN